MIYGNLLQSKNLCRQLVPPVRSSDCLEFMSLNLHYILFWLVLRGHAVTCPKIDVV